ncbi:MAG: hypothetical protein KDD25_01015 [Bdellovibrionales bacterium]|nr:hypothetical protein [Bdellovibrionales bacterium]
MKRVLLYSAAIATIFVNASCGNQQEHKKEKKKSQNKVSTVEDHKGTENNSSEETTLALQKLNGEFQANDQEVIEAELESDRENEITKPEKGDSSAAPLELGFNTVFSRLFADRALESRESIFNMSIPLKAGAPFGRKYDTSKINKFLRLNLEDAVHYAESQGVRVFRSRSDSVNFNFIDMAPEILKARFDESDPDQSLLGLFLPRYSDARGYLDNTAAIILGSRANQYILCHEFLHFLLNSHSNPTIRYEKNHGNATQESTDRLIDNVNRAWGDAIREVNRANSSKAEIQKAVNKGVVSLIELGNQLLVAAVYLAEEATVDSLLLGHLEMQPQSWFLEEDARNGKANIRESVSQLKRIFYFFETQFETLNSESILGNIGIMTKIRFEYLENRVRRAEKEANKVYEMANE